VKGGKNKSRRDKIDESTGRKSAGPVIVHLNVKETGESDEELVAHEVAPRRRRIDRAEERVNGKEDRGEEEDEGEGKERGASTKASIASLDLWIVSTSVP
jgi:hypothetical protein